MIPTLYRYSKQKWLTELINHGSIRLNPASLYKKIENDMARQDDEHDKSHEINGAKITHIKTGRNIIPRGPVRVESKISTDYYMLCFSGKYASFLYDEFSGSNACLEIFNKTEFDQVLYSFMDKRLVGWCGFDAPITYGAEGKHGAFFMKPMKYIFQFEWRYVWLPPNEIESLDPIDIKIGNLSNISRIHEKCLTSR